MPRPPKPVMLDALPKAAFSMLAGSELLKRLADRSGMARPAGAARRFVAGRTLDDALEAAAAVEGAGYHVRLEHLGPTAATTEAASAATDSYAGIVARSGQAAASRHLCVQLAEVGLAVDRATAFDNLRRLLDTAGPAAMFVRISAVPADAAAVSLDVAETLWNISYRHIGVEIHAARLRAPAEVDRFTALGVPVRLVRGSLREPRDVAHRDDQLINDAFRALAERLLRAGQQPALATHDPQLITYVRQVAARLGVDAEHFEFDMRQGVRTDLQADLRSEGYRVRLSVPFGEEWFPYYMQRLGERPGSLFRKP
jgi:proline dehydrogenase